jgi:wyosine [tRNA(Phe)-imidazoG37] synthetase (radical SAM superfamily)
MHKVSSIVKNYGIEMVSFLNLGEPFLCRQVGEQLAILRNENPGIFIVSHSNGLLIDTDEKRNAAMLLDEILFSIDGADQASYVKYQRGGDFEKAYSNMKSLIDYRNKRNSKKPRIKWKYILFNWNDKNELVASAIELAKQANVDALIFTPTLGPIWGISFRYYFTRSFERIGVRTWAGREIELS